jgi:hypothetical protein
MPITRTIPCAECGAASPTALTCWELLGHLLAQEQYDAELLDEHFLTVACYNLQHPAQFTAEALAGLRESLIDRLDRNFPTEHIRRRTSARFEGPTRVLTPEADRRRVPRVWRVTIADVSLPDHVEGAAQRVRSWAAAIRAAL